MSSKLVHGLICMGLGIAVGATIENICSERDYTPPPIIADLNEDGTLDAAVKTKTGEYKICMGTEVERDFPVSSNADPRVINCTPLEDYLKDQDHPEDRRKFIEANFKFIKNLLYKEDKK